MPNPLANATTTAAASPTGPDTEWSAPGPLVPDDGRGLGCRDAADDLGASNRRSGGFVLATALGEGQSTLGKGGRDPTPYR